MRCSAVIARSSAARSCSLRLVAPANEGSETEGDQRDGHQHNRLHARLAIRPLFSGVVVGDAHPQASLRWHSQMSAALAGVVSCNV
jgi:hypothetical protein